VFFFEMTANQNGLAGRSSVSFHPVDLQAEAAPSPAARTVLLAEDDPALRKLLSMVLRLAGYHVVSAFDGLNALQVILADSRKVDLLITDFEMPRMNGIQLASTAVGLRPDLKVLIVSGRYDPAIQQTGMRFLHKPFRPSELVERVEELLAEANARPALSCASSASK
jgi:DNA-binding response OmpR family regulator